jgi:hypothetical protein
MSLETNLAVPRVPTRAKALIVGTVLALTYASKNLIEEIVTTVKIDRVETLGGKKRAIEYAHELWREVHPGGETSLGNALYMGKKEAVLKYLGYRHLGE